MGIEDAKCIKEREARLKVILADDNLLDVMCSYVANGGTVVTLAETWDVRYSDLTRWIHADRVRERAYIQALNDRGEWGMETILRELRRIGMSDIRQIFADDGSLKPISEWPAEMGSVVSSIEVDELFEGSGRDREQVGFTKKVKLWDKMRSLELLGKNLKMFTEKIEHSGKLTLAELVEKSMKQDENQ